MFFPPFDTENSRYERKFVVSNMMLPQINQQIRIHPSAFTTIFHPRYINNIYLDSRELDFYYDNVSGRGSRKKARIRWYGNLFEPVEKPMLEFKIREGYLGNKRSFPLQPFVLDENLTSAKLQAVFAESNLPAWAMGVLQHLQPSLINCYLREYFLSFDGLFRLTTDTNLNYYGIAANNNHFIEHFTSNDVIVELKYDYSSSRQAPDISTLLPFRLTKSSKYVNGIDLLHPMLV